MIKIITTTKIIIPPQEQREILPKLLQSEKKLIHEAFVLKICATWEILAENVFVECLSRNTSTYAAFKGITLPRNLTKNTCKGLISGLRYFDFRDMSDLKGKAKRFLADQCNPFKKVPCDVTEKINEFYLIRNYIAHRSDTAKQSLKRMYKEKYKKRFRRPGDFLFDTVDFIEIGEREKKFASQIIAKLLKKLRMKWLCFSLFDSSTALSFTIHASFPRKNILPLANPNNLILQIKFE